jgi:TRL (tRNA-associated locus)-like protein
MVKKIAVFVIMSSSLVLSGCAGMGSIGGSAVPGGLYTQSKLPVSGVPGPHAKTGEACATSILGLIATGDASISAAMNNGGITDVSTVDYRLDNVLGIYATYCTVVKGN